MNRAAALASIRPAGLAGWFAGLMGGLFMTGSVLAETVPSGGESWMARDVLRDAANVIEAYHYKPVDSAAATRRVNEAALKLTAEPPEKFRRCLKDEARRSLARFDLGKTVDAAAICLNLDGLELSAREKAFAALFEALASGGDQALQIYPPRPDDEAIENEVQLAPPAVLGGGIGIDITDAPEGKRMVGSRRASPAREQGIMMGEVILAIDGRDAASMTLDEAAIALQGAPGSAVTLRVRPEHGGAERSVVLHRKALDELDKRILSRREGDLFIVDIRAMDGGEAQLLTRAWKVAGKGAKALVLDLRFNEGGTLDEAVELADALLRAGTITTVEGRSAQDRLVFRANAEMIAANVPVIVLIGPQTAAGAEIFAAALRDNGHALLLGQRSFGRGTIQSLYSLPRRVPLKLTTGEALRPNASSFDKSGILPDCTTHAEGAALFDLAARLAAEGLAACPAN